MGWPVGKCFVVFLILGVFSSIITLVKTTNVNSTMPSHASITKGKIESNESDRVDIFHVLRTFQTIESFIMDEFYPDHHNGTKDSRMLNVLMGLDKFQRNRFNHSSTCVNDTEDLLVGLLGKKSWAVQFLDATGKPGPSLTRGWLNFVGNFDQCKSAFAPQELSPEGTHRFRGGYFQVALKSETLPMLIQIGLCLPDSCSKEEVKSVGTEIFKTAKVPVSVAFVHHLTNATVLTSATIAAIVILFILGLMIIIGTFFDFVLIQFPLRYKENNIKKQNGIISSHHSTDREDRAMFPDEQKSPDTKSLRDASGNKRILNGHNALIKVIMSFSVYSNGQRILDTSQSADSLESIHGIRFFSISWVVLAHTFVFAQGYTLNAASSYSKFLNRWTFDVVANSFVSVDTFFTISGLLTSYITTGQLLQKGLKLNWPMFYFHRFWRLTPPYMLVILIYLGFQQYFIKGPLRNFEQPIDKSACETRWWTNLLYINNIVDSRDICFGHSWYLSNDMQFFVLSPLMTVPFYFHRFAGLCSCFVFLLASWISTGVLSTVNDWPAIGLNLKEILKGEVKYDWLYEYYTKPWCRIGPFIVGIVAGYILSIHKGRPLSMKWWNVLLGWSVTAISAVAIIYGLRGDITGEDTGSVAAASLYNSVARSAWGVCVSWIIIACKAGYGGPVNALLSWSPFVVLGRLSYMVYLIHVPIIFIFYQNLDQLMYLNDTVIVIYYLGFLFASNMIAFVLVICLESPMIGLEKAIFRKEG